MKTSNKPITSLFLFLTIMLMALPGCKNSSTNKNAPDNIELATTQDSLLYPTIVYLLPTPSEVLTSTLSNNFEFNSALLADENLDKNALYTNQHALLLGVYIADLSYNIVFHNHQGSLRNMRSIETLSDKLGLTALLYDTYFQRVEKNLQSVDSINAIFNDFAENSFSLIESTGNYELLSLIAIGAGIEALYLNFKSLDPKAISDKFLPNFIGLKAVYENYYKNYMFYNANKEELKNFNNDLNSIYKLFSLNVSTTKISSNNTGSVDAKEKISTKENNKFFKDFGDSIIIVRNKLVELKYQ